MHDDLVHLRIESDDFSCDDLQVFELAGRESLGKLFALSIGVVTTRPPGLNLAVVEGATATLVLEANGQEVRRIHGMIAEIRDRIDTEPDTRSYFLLLVPRAHRLSLVRTQEIFMDLSVPEIIQKKLELVGLGADDVEMRLSGTTRRPTSPSYRASPSTRASRSSSSTRAGRTGSSSRTRTSASPWRPGTR
jgi:type VI secretion system secreted protein VgrG